jgi:hypothetical protein
MTTVSSLISTSVSDARITLHALVQSNPQHAALLSLQLLERLHRAEGQASRRQAAAMALRAAAKRVAEDDTPDPKGPDITDLYYTLPVGDLRKMLAQANGCHQHRAERILTTLVTIRGEVKCDSRRKLLLTALGKSAKALAEGQGRAAA